MNYTKMAKYLMYEAALNVMPGTESAAFFGGAFGVDRDEFTPVQADRLRKALRREQERLADRLRKQGVIE
jgi:hypothetical protein